MWRSTLRRNLRKALVGGLSTVATVAMLGVSGQAMGAVTVSANSVWNVADPAGADTDNGTISADQDLTMTGAATLTINDATADNLAIASIGSGAGTGEIIVTPAVAADIEATISGNVNHGGALKITGTSSATALLTLKGASNTFGGGVILDADDPGVSGKATLAFLSASAQTFNSKIDGAAAGEGILELIGTDTLTFKQELGSIQSLYGVVMKGAGDNTAIFEKNVNIKAGGADFVMGDGFGSETYTATFDPTDPTLAINARLQGTNGDTSNVIIKGGAGKTITQGATFTWGNVNPLSKLEIQDSGTKFVSNAVIKTNAVILKNGTEATFNNAGHIALNLTKEAGSKIILGPVIGKDDKVFGDGAVPSNVTTTAGTVSIHVSATGLSPGDIIYLADSNANITGVDANTVFSITDDDSAVYFKEDYTTDPTQFRLVAHLEPTTPPPSSPASGLPYPQNHAQIITGVKQIARDMRDQPVRAASARMKSERFAKYSRTAFRFGDAGSREFQRTDGPGSRDADGRGFQRTNDRGLRDADGRGFQRSNERGLRDADGRGFQKAEDRKLREGDDRGFRKGEDRKLREAEDRGLQKAEDRKLREAEERKLREAEERESQKPVDRPTGVSFGDSPIMPENAWMEAFGDWVDQDSKTSRQGNYTIDGYDADIYGVAIGVDTEVVSDVLLGVAFSYSNADVDWLGASKAAGDIDHYQLTLYGEYRHDKFYLEGMLGYAMNDYDISDLDTTDDSTRKSDFDSNQYLARLELGVPIYMGNEIFITPRAELDWDRLDVDGYTQTGTGNNLLIVNPNDWDSTTASLGVEVRQRIKKNKGYIIPSAYAGVSYDLAGEEASVSAARTNAPTTLYSIRGMDNEQFATEVELGLEYEVGQWSVGAKYEGRFKATRDLHSASLLAEYKF